MLICELEIVTFWNVDSDGRWTKQYPTKMISVLQRRYGYTWSTIQDSPSSTKYPFGDYIADRLQVKTVIFEDEIDTK